MTILLLTATAIEQQGLAGALEEPVRVAVAGRTWTRGLLDGRAVQLVETGLGAVNTAHALTRALGMERPRFVLQIGVGGAYPGGGVAVGQLAVACAEHYGDLGVRTPGGWRPADAIGIPVATVAGVPRFNEFPVDDRLSRAAARCLTAVRGPFVTVQECSGTTALARERAARVPGALCESMEGAAAAHVCALCDVPFLEVRAMSNLVGDRDLAAWDLPGACARAQEAARRLLAELAP